MMKTITYEQFLKIDPYYHDGSEKHALMAAIAARRERWSALDLLALDEGPSGQPAVVCASGGIDRRTLAP